MKYIGQTYPSNDNPPYLLFFLKVLLVFQSDFDQLINFVVVRGNCQEYLTSGGGGTPI